ncbi:alcohol dehydrogenase [Clavulina sp. PMI_390]|nr:alcohol dehydrogenase [Clavulina sp. PMI_390]
MKAFRVAKHEHPADITPASDAPEPTAGPGQVIVEVYSAGLNFFDILQAQGKYQHQPPMPFNLGAEYAGRIAKNSPIPEGCPFKPGDRVFGATQGAYADRVTADVNRMFPIPKGMSYDQASGLYVTWPTSYEGIIGRGEAKAGDWVLVHAGAGGVGIAAIQVLIGAKVIATAGSPEKLEVCKKYGGADYVLNYRTAGWQKEIMKITKGHGVDVIYDPVGLIRDSLKCIAWKGRAVVVGFVGGEIEKLPLNLVLLKNIAITGLHWGAYAKFEPSREKEVWDALFEMWESKKTVPIVYTTVFKGLEGVGKGLKAIENRETWGKVAVHLRDEDPSAKL